MGAILMKYFDANVTMNRICTLKQMPHPVVNCCSKSYLLEILGARREGPHHHFTEIISIFDLLLLV